MLQKLAVGMIILGTFSILGSRLRGASPNVSQKHAPSMHIEQFGAYNALRSISRKADIPIGVEGIIDYKSEATVSFDFPGGTVADLLNMFVSQAPEYRWDEAGAIIHVFRNAKALPIATVMIAYPGTQNKTREEIWNDLARRLELKAWLDANHCERQELFGGKEFRAYNGPISIHAGNMTLSQLLDEVALKSGENYWAILQTQNGQECRMSISLW